MRNPHAGEPFDTPDGEIAEALLDVSVPTLLLSLVHMSGDPSIIRGHLRPRASPQRGAGLHDGGGQGRGPGPRLEVIRDYRDRGCPEPEPVSPELLHEMMSWLVCEDVPEEYVPLLLEEMELDGRDARRVEPAGTADARAAFPVVVIGCGQSGLLAGIRLQEAGIPFTIVEKNAGVGGPGGRTPTPRPCRRRQPLLLLLVRAE